MAATPVRIAVVSDYALVGDGVRRFLAPLDATARVDWCLPTGTPPPSPVDVALYDTFGRTGIDLGHLRALLDDPAATAVAVYAFEPPASHAAAALDAGAAAVLSKAAPPRHLAEALVAIAGGAEPPAAPAGVGRATREERGWPGQQLGLSEREAEVVALAALGQRNREIADALDVSVDTVKTHLARSFRKLDVHNRTALSALVHTSAEFRRTPVPA
ncbi:MAG TPA: response regulator transcription factor [Aquihabitans sp.]|nr:response regulator transcription factor [Aquihabitans sp.]